MEHLLACVTCALYAEHMSILDRQFDAASVVAVLVRTFEQHILDRKREVPRPVSYKACVDGFNAGLAETATLVTKRIESVSSSLHSSSDDISDILHVLLQRGIFAGRQSNVEALLGDMVIFAECGTNGARSQISGTC